MIINVLLKYCISIVMNFYLLFREYIKNKYIIRRFRSLSFILFIILLILKKLCKNLKINNFWIKKMLNKFFPTALFSKLYGSYLKSYKQKDYFIEYTSYFCHFLINKSSVFTK